VTSCCVTRSDCFSVLQRIDISVAEFYVMFNCLLLVPSCCVHLNRVVSSVVSFSNTKSRSVPNFFCDLYVISVGHMIPNHN
jgi:hypothetical protein